MNTGTSFDLLTPAHLGFAVSIGDSFAPSTPPWSRATGVAPVSARRTYGGGPGAFIDRRRVERQVGKSSVVFVANEEQYGFRKVDSLCDLLLSCSLITENINLRGLMAGRGGGTGRRHVTAAHLKPLN